MKIFEQGTEKLGIPLSEKQFNQFETYFHEIVDWNQKVNLTAILDYDEIMIKHFLDSLTLVQGFQNVVLPAGLSVIDIGTGAGLPGIPLKIAFPEIKLTLLEATAKKTEFLKYVVSTLRLNEVEILTARAEDQARVGKYRERYDIVTARAVTQLAALAELTLPFSAIGGRCILPKKGDTEKEIEEAQNAIQILGGEMRTIEKINLEGLEDDRHLIIIEKVSPTPDKYPRRPGIPAKRPIR